MAIAGNTIKEHISIAFIHALSASAGCSFDVLKADEISIDAVIKKKFSTAELGIEYAPANLDVQLKSSSVLNESETQVTFDLPVKNYNDLRLATNTTAMLLVVLQLADNEEEWVTTEDDSLTARRSAYWYNLAGCPETTNKYAVTVRIPKQNRLTKSSLYRLMASIAKEEPIQNSEVPFE